MDKPILGVDVGGVILDFVPYMNTDRSFDGDNYLNTPEVPGAVETLAALNKGKFAGRIFLVSRFKYDDRRIKEWLAHIDFYSRTSILEDHLYPCKERHEKEEIVRRLGVTHFVDDRAEVLSHMIGTVPHLYLFQGLDEDRAAFAHMQGKMAFVQNWEELARLLGGTK